MKLANAYEQYQYFSGEASKLSRQLAIAAIGIIWLFKVDSPGGFHVPPKLIPVAGAAVLALTLDFFQYAYGACVWGFLHRQKELSLGPASEKDFPVRREVNWPTIVLFWAKVIVTGIAYVMLLEFLIPLFRR